MENVCACLDVSHNGEQEIDMSTQGGLNRRIRIRFPLEARNFSHFQSVQTDSGSLPTFYHVGTLNSFPGNKAARA
jgi:hypothetical protein